MATISDSNGNSSQQEFATVQSVVRNTIEISGSLDYSNLKVIAEAAKSGDMVRKTQNGYIYKSNYAPDRWVEVGKTDSGTAYISILKVINTSENETSKAIGAPGNETPPPSPPAYAGNASESENASSPALATGQPGMPFMNAQPPAPPGQKPDSSSFDSNDALVAQEELSYLYDNNIVRDNSLNSAISAISGFVGSVGAVQSAPAAASPPIPESSPINPSDLPKQALSLNFGFDAGSNPASNNAGTQGFATSAPAIVPAPGGAPSRASTAAPPGGEASVPSLGAIAALLGVLAFGLAIAAAAAFVVMQLTGIFKQPDISQIEDFKVLSNGTRFEILACLADAERIPTDISSMLNKSKSTIS
ncbi:MAG TPA: hypothetical protein PLO51_01080 [Candidatus Micrarchaeota archaeon]|nr:hypothetical protein [Candidatus Micrarchaeota archaeon]